MNIIEENGNIILEDVCDFNIEQTLECGQCFHFDKIDENEYIVVAYGKMLHILQQDKKVTLFDTDRTTYDTVWKGYFDLDRDYAAIKDYIVNSERKNFGKNTWLVDAVNEKGGVRILNQEPFETLISFIISQNKQIPHIKQIVRMISRKYGEKVGEYLGEEYFAFPTIEKLKNVSENEFRLCKTGFRAPYIKDACEKCSEGNINLEIIAKMPHKDAVDKLMTIKGVGSKVANCVSLFALGNRDAFPVDVWVKRLMEELYFMGEDKQKDAITEFAQEVFGPYGGYAQQYMFYYGRENNIGV